MESFKWSDAGGEYSLTVADDGRAVAKGDDVTSSFHLQRVPEIDSWSDWREWNLCEGLQGLMPEDLPREYADLTAGASYVYRIGRRAYVARETHAVIRPTIGHEYWAPVSAKQSFPLVYGERWGIIVDSPSQDVAVVYTSQERAQAALNDPAIWAPGNAARVLVRKVRYRGAGMPSFLWADTEGVQL